MMTKAALETTEYTEYTENRQGTGGKEHMDGGRNGGNANSRS